MRTATMSLAMQLRLAARAQRRGRYAVNKSPDALSLSEEGVGGELSGGEFPDPVFGLAGVDEGMDGLRSNYRFNNADAARMTLSLAFISPALAEAAMEGRPQRDNYDETDNPLKQVLDQIQERCTPKAGRNPGVQPAPDFGRLRTVARSAFNSGSNESRSVSSA